MSLSPMEENSNDPFEDEAAEYSEESDVALHNRRRGHRAGDYGNYGSEEVMDTTQKFYEEMEALDSSPTRVRERDPRSKRGKLVTFYRNGDPHFRGFTTSVSEKDFRNFDTLLQWLTEKIDTPSGVRFVFSLHDGKEVRSIEEFKQVRSYVVSSVNKLNVNSTYGPKRQRVWSTQKPPGDKIRNEETQLFLGTSDLPLSPPLSRRPRILTIISNLDRSSREKLILNPQTSLTFEEMLSDLTSLIRVPRPPVKSLYTERVPHTLIQSFSQLLREFKDHVNFIACGEEGKPVEMTQKRHAPGSNSSNDSIASFPIRKPTKFQKYSVFGSEATNSRTDNSVDMSNVHSDTPFPNGGTTNHWAPIGPIQKGTNRQAHYNSKWQKTEAVRISIHGRRREFYRPTMIDTDDDGAKPDKVLKLDWVYGYRGKDARSNLFVIPGSGELLYFVGAVAVLYDKKTEVQRHYCGHNEDITSMALHPGKRLVASGQLAGKTPDSGSHVRIWDTISLSTYSIIGLGDFQTAISSVAFSGQSDGDFVLVVDDGERHTLSVWDWQNSKLAAKTTTTTDMVVWGSFHNLDDTVLVTFGKKHIYFWKLFWNPRQEGEGKILRDKESGVFHDEIPKFVTSLAFSQQGDVVVGDSNGSITVWTRDETDAFRINHACSDHMKHAHKKSVFSLYMLDDGTLLSGGGSEIKAWDSMNYYVLVKDRALPDTAGYIRTLMPVTQTAADCAIYIGTTKNHVLEGSLQHKFKFVVQGHSEELWALAVHPKEPCFFTAGYDRQVCRWSTIMHSVAWRMQVEKPCVCIATDPGGKLLAVGTTDGRAIVMSVGNGMHITTVQVGLDQINVLKFSPNGLLLAVGCHDGTICIYEVMDDGFYFRKNGTLVGHKNFVTHLDWSCDNRCLQSVSADYDLYFWNVEKLDQVTAPRAMRDVDWSSQSCVLSYNVIGPWSNLRPGEDIDCVCRSGFREYLAVGRNVGTIQLYKYPCSSKKAQCYTKKAFSSHVTSVQFAMEDRYLITAGGSEAVLIQWAVKTQFS